MVIHYIYEFLKFVGKLVTFDYFFRIHRSEIPGSVALFFEDP